MIQAHCLDQLKNFSPLDPWLGTLFIRLVNLEFARVQLTSNLFSFALICFDSSQIFEEIASLSFQVSWTHQFLTEVKKNLDFGIFRLGLSNFWIGTWFPFNVFQLNVAEIYTIQEIFHGRLTFITQCAFLPRS